MDIIMKCTKYCNISRSNPPIALAHKLNTFERILIDFS